MTTLVPCLFRATVFFQTRHRWRTCTSMTITFRKTTPENFIELIKKINVHLRWRLTRRSREVQDLGPLNNISSSRSLHKKTKLLKSWSYKGRRTRSWLARTSPCWLSSRLWWSKMQRAREAPPRESCRSSRILRQRARNALARGPLLNTSLSSQFNLLVIKSLRHLVHLVQRRRSTLLNLRRTTFATCWTTRYCPHKTTRSIFLSKRSSQATPRSPY